MNVALFSDDIPAGLKGTANLVTSGTVATITWLCGGDGTFDEGYTATATELVLIAASEHRPHVHETVGRSRAANLDFAVTRLEHAPT